GLSGVGKSSLLSLITPDELETGTVSEKIQRGKHTTRHVELFELEDDGFVLDTPGFSSLEVEGIKAEDLWQYFPEMAESQNRCRFRGCSHINEPDCFVKDMIESGELAQSRYDSYCQLYNKLKTVKEWEKK
ncbi:MAG: ribosome small subunit-dependent GTPase A, partial [Clostridia bacterium]|nr:ribosome small subunit-dependent GTPase A [Clostridia bacterium]